jgi:hypothetical protein
MAYFSTDDYESLKPEEQKEVDVWLIEKGMTKLGVSFIEVGPTGNLVLSGPDLSEESNSVHELKVLGTLPENDFPWGVLGNVFKTGCESTSE